MPLYCETFLAAASSYATRFPVEPVNTWTSLIPIASGLLAMYWLYKHNHRDYVTYVLAFLTFSCGVGSVLWHGTRTDWALTLDVLPGVLCLFIVVAVWPLRLKNRFWSYGVLFGLFGTIYLSTHTLSALTNLSPLIAVFASVAVFGFGLLYFTYTRCRAAFLWASIMIASALLAAVARVADLLVCDVIPIGTHFIWHAGLGTAAYAGVRTLTLFKIQKDASLLTKN